MADQEGKVLIICLDINGLLSLHSANFPLPTAKAELPRYVYLGRIQITQPLSHQPGILVKSYLTGASQRECVPSNVDVIKSKAYPELGRAS